MAEYDKHTYDVLVIGAGGAGLRAAIEASSSGARVGLVCKSLLGKAHSRPAIPPLVLSSSLFVSDCPRIFSTFLLPDNHISAI